MALLWPVMRGAAVSASLAAVLSMSPVVLAASNLTPYSLGSQSQKIPAGTVLPLVIDSPLDARTTVAGTPVLARLGTDFVVQPASQQPSRVVLPKDTAVRGRVTEVKRPGWLSRGGWMTMQFDQVVLPDGTLLPIALTLSAQNDKTRVAPAKIGSSNVANPGPVGLYQDPGVGAKLKADVAQGGAQLDAITQAGMAHGEKLWGTPGKIIAAPIAALGGAAVGAGTIAAESVKSVFLPGESVIIEPGTALLVDFGGAFDIPVE